MIGNKIAVKGIVETKLWSTDELRRQLPGWDDLDRDIRHQILTESPPIKPVHSGTTENMVMNNYLEELAAGNNPQPTHLAIGDGTTAPDPNNDELNNEVYRTAVGQDEANGRERITSTFVSQNEANGNALREIGFVSGSTSNPTAVLLTHVVLDTSDQIADKTSNMTVTYNYILEFMRENA